MPPDDLPSPLQPITWLDSGHYPTRITRDIALGIAQTIAHGVNWRTAGMQYGIAPSRLRKWLRWGEEAYHADAGPSHPHADCLDLFLMVMQAAGIVAAQAQTQAYIDNPAWWLMHNPDQRGAWGQQAEPQEPLETITVEADETATATPQPFTADEKRQILRTFIAAGAAILPSDLEQTVDTSVESPAEDSERNAG